MLNDTVASGIRGRISDFHTQNVSAYNPDGLESLDTYVQYTPIGNYHG
jgi:gamma-glutamyltranspeptidase/glutathione hydrolase